MLKNTSILLLLAILSFYACEQTITNAYEKNYTLELSRDTVVFNVGGGQKSVEILTNQEWWEYTDNDNGSWYSVKDFHDADGYEMLTISTDSCTELATQEATLTINAGDKYSTKLHIIQLGNDPHIYIGYDSITIDKDTAVFELNYVSNVKFEIENTAPWITVKQTKSLEENSLQLYIQKNETAAERQGEIIFKQTDGDYTQKLHITQLAELSDYKPFDPESIKGNKLIPVLSGKASTVGEGYDIAAAFDGDTATYFQTGWEEKPNSLELNFTVDLGTDLLNYIVYYPSRLAADQAIKIAQVKYRKKGEENFTNMTMAMLDQNKPTMITPAAPIAEVEEVKFSVMQSYAEAGLTAYAASCAEVEFYTNSVLYEQIFTDITCSELLPTVSMKEILNIDDMFYRNIAKHLYNGTYQVERIVDVEAIQQDRKVAKINKASLYEYATGIHVDAGEEVVVFCGETAQAPSLMVLNSSKKTAYPLIEGVNKLAITTSGKVYVNNPSDVKIHIAGGNTQGILALEDLSSLVAPEDDDTNVVDVYGNNTHLIMPTLFAKAEAEQLPVFNENMTKIIDAAKVFYGVKEGEYQSKSRLGFYLDEESDSLETLVNLNKKEFDAVCQTDGSYNEIIFSVLEKVGSAYEPYLNKLWGVEGTSSKLFALAYFYENNDLSIVKDKDYYAQAVQDIIVSNRKYNDAESDWSKVVPLWQMYHIMKNAYSISDYYAQLCALEKAKSSAGNYTTDLLNFTNQVSGENFNDFFFKWNMGGKASAEPAIAGLAYYNEDNLSIYQEMGALVPGRFFQNAKMLIAYKNMVAIEFYNAGFLAHVALYKPGNRYMVAWDKYDKSMKVKVVGPSGESAEPIYF